MKIATRDIGRAHAAIAREVAGLDRAFAKPVVILSGGETAVTLRGKGKGRRKSELLLSLLSAIDGVVGIAALAADTAGEMRAKGLDPLASLSANDAWSAFDAIG